MRKPTSNAVTGYRKSRMSIVSTHTAKLVISQKILCIHSMPKPNLLQRCFKVRRLSNEKY